MNTFFINTSAKKLDFSYVLFDIYLENKSLVLLDCPLADWLDPDKGYQSCFRRMSEMIDGYADLNNDLNLLIYIDLRGILSYRSLAPEAEHDWERERHASALRTIYRHMIRQTIVEELIGSGRGPQSVLLMFGEEAPVLMEGVHQGHPGPEKIRECLQKYFDQSAPDGEVAYQFIPAYTDDLIDRWCKNKDTRNLSEFCKSVEAKAKQTGMESISCPYDSRACGVNKSARTMDCLNIALHILRCVQEGSIYSGSGEEKKLIAFRCGDAKEIAQQFLEREAIYSRKMKEIRGMTQKYSALNLAPPLYAFDCAKFGLNKHGSKEPSDGKDPAGKSLQTQMLIPKYLLQTQDNDSADVKQLQGMDAPVPDEPHKKNAGADDYLALAARLREKDQMFLQDLGRNARSVLSHYAGRSKENRAPLLTTGGNNYIKNKNQQETETLEVVEEVADQAYQSVLREYMQFCAVRSLSVVNLDDQYEAFQKKIGKIKESLKGIGYAAIILLVATLALYIPFFVIQFSAIFANILTLSVALCSLLVPLVLLYLIFGLITDAEKKRFGRAWKEFKDARDEMMKGNLQAVRQFNELLFTKIPALRWVYDYQLDVRYYAECCTAADAKIEHHLTKLKARVEAIRNIRSAVEAITPDEYSHSGEDLYSGVQYAAETKIEYDLPFCVGKVNRNFYAVIHLQSLEDPSGTEETI